MFSEKSLGCLKEYQGLEACRRLDRFGHIGIVAENQKQLNNTSSVSAMPSCRLQTPVPQVGWRVKPDPGD